MDSSPVAVSQPWVRRSSPLAGTEQLTGGYLFAVNKKENMLIQTTFALHLALGLRE